jgi:hypothetical protein
MSNITINKLRVINTNKQETCFDNHTIIYIPNVSLSLWGNIGSVTSPYDLEYRVVVAPKHKNILQDILMQDRRTEVQKAAVDYYTRGLNVFPVPQKEEIEAWAVEKPKKPEKRDKGDKPPYLLNEFFTSRMHLCQNDCVEHERLFGVPCKEGDRCFYRLFENANIGCMTGKTSGNLLCIDCDSHTAFIEMEKELDKRNIPYWKLSSHRGGGFLIRILEGEANSISEEKSSFQDVQIWANSHYINLPPSRHNRGTIYTWQGEKTKKAMLNGELPPVVSINDLDWLGVTLENADKAIYTEPELFGLPECAKYLSLNNQKILSSIIPKGSRNSQFTKAAYDIAGNIIRGNISQSEGESLLIESARRSGYPVNSILQMLKSAIKKNPTPAKSTQPFQHKLKPFELAQNFADNYDWHIYKRMVQTAKSTFLACIQRSRMDGSNTFRASEREITELALFGDKGRADKGLSLLRDSTPTMPPLIKLIGKSESTDSNLYAFTDVVTGYALKDVAQNNPSIPTLAVCSGVIPNNQTKILPTSNGEKDVFRKIRNTCWELWNFLQSQPVRNGSGIQKAIGMNRSTAQKALERLVRYGLAQFDSVDNLYRRIDKSEEDLIELAKQLGIFGRTDIQKKKHNIERYKWVNYKLARTRKLWNNRLDRYKQEELLSHRNPHNKG